MKKRGNRQIRFTPETAIEILVRADSDSVSTALRTWALAALLGWMTLDQRPHKSRQPTLHTTNASQAGRIALGYLLEKRLRKARSLGDWSKEDVLPKLFILYFEVGALTAPLRGRNATTLIRRARETTRELGYMYRIVQNLCRGQIDPNTDDFYIEDAKALVLWRRHEGRDTYGESKISAIWETYKEAAPYVYSFYPVLLRGLAKGVKTRKMMRRIEAFSKGTYIPRLLGIAADASDVIRRMRKLKRPDEFDQVMRVRRRLLPFDDDEKAIITQSIKERRSPRVC